MIAYLFNVLEKYNVVASIDLDNTKSIRLVERLGFKNKGHLKDAIQINGEWVGDLIYELTSTQQAKHNPY